MDLINDISTGNITPSISFQFQLAIAQNYVYYNKHSKNILYIILSALSPESLHTRKFSGHQIIKIIDSKPSYGLSHVLFYKSCTEFNDVKN